MKVEPNTKKELQTAYYGQLYHGTVERMELRPIWRNWAVAGGEDDKGKFYETWGKHHILAWDFEELKHLMAHHWTIELNREVQALERISTILRTCHQLVPGDIKDTATWGKNV